MDNSSITHKLYNTFKDDKLSFAYMGFLSNQLVISAIGLIEQHLSVDRGFKKFRHKLSFLMIESFQNILRYGDEPLNKDLKYRKEMFLVRNIAGTFYIGSTNLIENKKIEYVKSKLTQVNKLDMADLHQLYRKILTNNTFTDAGGAGLGFIEMARKTNQKLQFEFVKVDEEYSYFYLLILVKGDSENHNNIQPMDINWIKDFHTLMCKKNIILLHKGNFSPIVIDPVIYLVQHNVKSKAVNIQKLTFNVILEALQNLSHHSLAKNDEKEAIFIISRKNNKHTISTGNFIKASKVKHLESQLEHILSLSKTDIKKLYNETLQKKQSGRNKEIGLGLIEIALESNKKFKYQFSKIDKTVSFYSFDVVV
jgi:hypothetical protein